MEEEIQRIIKTSIEEGDYDTLRDFMLKSLEDVGGPVTGYAIYTIKLLIAKLEEYDKKESIKY